MTDPPTAWAPPAGQPVAPPPPPEDPHAPPRWPPRYAVFAFLTGVSVSLVLVGVVAVIAGIDSGEEESPAVVIVGTLLLEGAMVGSALLFASLVKRPRAWHFGLRSTRFWPAVGWAVLGLFSFYLFSAIYALVVDPDAEQRVTESLGADTGTVGLILAGFMVIVVAPVAEEFFFRGFFYRALRTRLGVFTAAVIDGALFGVIHFDFSGGDAALLLPPLALLGFVFCLVYERTGSLYPVIALHAFNNSLAYSVQADGGAVSAVLAPLTIAGCVQMPRVLRSEPAAAT